MEGNSNLSNYSNNSMQVPITSDGTAAKNKSQFLEKDSTIRPYKYKELSKAQFDSCQSFSCGNKGIDTFLSHGDGLKFQIDRNKMSSMFMATENQVVSYMAYSMKEASFYVPKHCSPKLYHDIGLQPSDKVLVIHYVGVDQSFKRMGLGTAMVMKAFIYGINYAKTDPKLRLIILHSTPEACKFYENLGFDRIGNIDENLIEYSYTLVE